VLHLIEAKSARTISQDFFSGMRRLADIEAPRAASVEQVLVYGGDEKQRRHGARVVPWSRLDQEQWEEPKTLA